MCLWGNARLSQPPAPMPKLWPPLAQVAEPCLLPEPVLAWSSHEHQSRQRQGCAPHLSTLFPALWGSAGAVQGSALWGAGWESRDPTRHRLHSCFQQRKGAAAHPC